MEDANGILYIDELERCAPHCVPEYGPVGDIFGPAGEPDCIVNEWDLAAMLDVWLAEENLGSENLYQDGIIDFKNYAELASSWLEKQLLGE